MKVGFISIMGITLAAVYRPRFLTRDASDSAMNNHLHACVAMTSVEASKAHIKIL